MDYNSLTLQIQNYTNRTDNFFVSQIPDFINQGINRIYSEAKNIGFEITANDTLTTNTATLAKPANWRETISFAYTNLVTPNLNFLFPRSNEFCKVYSPLQTGLPLFYSDNLGYTEFYLSPTPDQDYPIQLVYFGLPLFNAQNLTNFLTDRYPSLLLYACLLETTPFLRDDERTPVFESLYNRALQDINRDTKERITDRTTKRDQN